MTGDLAIGTFRTGGLTVVMRVDPAAPGVVAEAWVGGGEGDPAVAHLAEHVAVAQADGALDGRTTPDATIVRGVGAELAAALAPVWRAITAERASLAVVEAEAEAIARETDGPAPTATATALERWWQRSWRGQRATLVVAGRFAPAAVAAWVRPWPGRHRASSPLRRASRTPDRLVLPGPAPTAREAPAAALAAAATGRAALLSGAFVVDDRAPLVWPDADDRDAWIAARLAAARLPVVGADGWIGEAAAAHHVAADPGWPRRHRRALARTSPPAIAAAVRALLHAQAAAPPAPRRAVQARPSTAPTRRTVGATRVVVAAHPAAAIAVRWSWSIGADPERLAPLAAAAIVRCFEARGLDGLSAHAELAVTRDRLELRAELAIDGWAAALAELAACVAAPDASLAAHDRDRARLAAVAAAVTASPVRQALAAFARARYGAHPLAVDVAAVAPVGALPDALTWWAARRRAPAVLAVVGPVELDAIAAVLDPRAAIAPPAPPPRPIAPPRELYLDGRPGDTAVVLGLDAVGATDPDRAALDVLAAVLAAPGALPAGTRVAVADTLDAGYLALGVANPRDRAATVRALEAALAATLAAPPDALAVDAARARLAAHRDRRGPLAREADELAQAELGAPPLAAVDAAAVARVARRVLVLDRAVIVTVRGPDLTPAVERRQRAPARRGRRRR